MDTYPLLADEDVPIILQHERVYSHATVRINYTTYDLQREQDIVHASTDKADILVHTPGESPPALPPTSESLDVYPWTYARVLGVYHANVLVPGTAKPFRVDFLHVRWFQRDISWEFGARARRLERIHFVPNDFSFAFGFVSPSHVIRACHLIPAFHHLRTLEYHVLGTLKETGNTSMSTGAQSPMFSANFLMALT